MMRSILQAVLLLSFSLSLSAPVRAQTVRTIALTGQHAPGTIGDVRFDGFDVPQLNSAGQVVFAADLRGEGVGCTQNGNVCNYSGLWMGDAGSLAIVMRGGDPAPGLPAGVRFTSFNEPNLTVSSSGPLAFQAGAFGPDGSSYGGVWAGTAGSLNLALLVGDHAPGTPADYVFWNFDGPGHFRINSSGQSVLSSEMLASTYLSDSHGIWSNRTGALALVARAGDHAPGMPADVYLDGPGTAVLNSSGYVAFHSVLTGGGFGYLHDTSIWSDRSGSLALIASSDQHAPGTNSGVVFRGVGGYPAIDATGHIAFNGSLNGPGVTAANDEGIWSDVGGSLSLVARTGDHAPGMQNDVNYGSFFDLAPLFNPSGKIAFAAGLIGGGVDQTNDAGIWSNARGSLRLVMRKGDSAPGMTGKVFSNFDEAMLNDAGQVAFRGFLTNPGQIYDCCSGAVAIKGLWAEDAVGNLHLIVREGGQIEVAPGDVRTVESFESVDEATNGDGSPYSFNGRGQFAFYAYFTNGTSGIFVSDVAAAPEPSSIALLLMSAIASAARRRRR